MSSVLRPVRKRKKGRTLGPVEIIRREDYADLELDAKVELIRSLVPLGLMHVEELLDAEVTAAREILGVPVQAGRAAFQGPSRVSPQHLAGHLTPSIT